MTQRLHPSLFSHPGSAGRPKLNTILFGVEFNDSTLAVIVSPIFTGSKELDLLGKVNGSMPGKNISQHRRKETNREETMGDPPSERSFLCIGLH